MHMLNLVIADAELETIPSEMINDPVVRRFAKNRNKKVEDMILDSNYLHTSIDKYFPSMSKRRGRPDIIYILLQVTQESILNRKNMLRTYIHTRNNLVININPLTRIPKSYNRFIGLFEDLFRKKTIGPKDKVLLSLHEEKLPDLVSGINSGKNIVLTPRGKFAKPKDFINEKNITLIIGGFSEGDFISDVSGIKDQYSIFQDELTIWSVGFEMIATYERLVDLL